ncbi:MAG: cysteine dioxygenase [Saprospiraceae bacterium]|jgi:cysteine dioxygenase
MNYITSIEQLTETLDKADPLDHAKIMKKIKLEAHEMEPFITWSKECYTRNCLARTNQYELILLCWEIGAKTPIHGHGGEDCWVYQVQGTVEEKRFEENGAILNVTNKMILTPGKLTYMNDRMGYHSIENISNQRAMTLHIYALPIDTCKVYNDDEDCFEIKAMSYHTFKGNEIETPVH